MSLCTLDRLLLQFIAHNFLLALIQVSFWRYNSCTVVHRYSNFKLTTNGSHSKNNKQKASATINHITIQGASNIIAIHKLAWCQSCWGWWRRLETLRAVADNPLWTYRRRPYQTAAELFPHRRCQVGHWGWQQPQAGNSWPTQLLPAHGSLSTSTASAHASGVLYYVKLWAPWASWTSSWVSFPRSPELKGIRESSTFAWDP